MVKTDQGSPFGRVLPKLGCRLLQMIFEAGVRGAPNSLGPFIRGIGVDPLYSIPPGFLKQPFVDQPFKKGAVQLLEMVPLVLHPGPSENPARFLPSTCQSEELRPQLRSFLETRLAKGLLPKTADTLGTLVELSPLAVSPELIL